MFFLINQFFKGIFDSIIYKCYQIVYSAARVEYTNCMFHLSFTFLATLLCYSFADENKIAEMPANFLFNQPFLSSLCGIISSLYAFLTYCSSMYGSHLETIPHGFFDFAPSIKAMYDQRMVYFTSHQLLFPDGWLNLYSPASRHTYFSIALSLSICKHLDEAYRCTNVHTVGNWATIISLRCQTIYLIIPHCYNNCKNIAPLAGW